MAVSTDVTNAEDRNKVERLVAEHPEAAESLLEKVGPSAEKYLRRILDDVQ